MDKLKSILELYANGVAIKKISRLTGVSRNTIKKYIRLGKAPTDQIEHHTQCARELATTVLNQVKLDQIDQQREASLQAQLPQIIKELGRVGVSRHLLWEEYIHRNNTGYSYSRFCRKIAEYKRRDEATLRIERKACHQLSVDFAGKKMKWIDLQSGEERYAEVLVCTMPYSSYTFAVALSSQRQEDFILGLNSALKYMGGLPQSIQSDNLKSYVKKADRYEPTFAELCIQLSSYYGIELEATRVAKPKDKPNVERHVSIVYQRLYAPLRDEVFHSLSQINEAFVQQLEIHNAKPFQGKDHSRKDKFEQDEKPFLQPLPAQLFEIKKSTKSKVQRNYHVFIGEDKHYYSVPFNYIGKDTEVVYTHSTVEVYCQSERIAVHSRNRRSYGYTTLVAHMPEKHIAYLKQKGWDAEYFKNEALKIGPMTHWAISSMLQSKSFVEQTYNACLGVIRLQNKYSKERLEAACQKANTTHRVNYGILKNILENNMDQAPDQSALHQSFSTPHNDNVRGEEYYQ